MSKKYLHQKQLSCLAALSPAASSDMNHSPLTSHYSLKRKLAFTLAETLITLGIIGVVAALTLPSVITNYQEKATVVKLKKCFTQISQAYMNILTEEGGSDSLKAGTDVELMQKFGKYLKYQKVCGRQRGCFPSNMYKSVTGVNYSTFDDNNRDTSRAILADGTLIMFNISRVAGNSNNKLAFAQIYVDINGFKGPNQLGRDFFYFYLTPDKVFPGGAQETVKWFPEQEFTVNCLKQNGFACAAWVIYNENMDYLHCKDLDWSTKTKCK